MLSKIAWWAIWNVKLPNFLLPWIMGIALKSWPRKK